MVLSHDNIIKVSNVQQSQVTSEPQPSIKFIRPINT